MSSDTLSFIIMAQKIRDKMLHLMTIERKGLKEVSKGWMSKNPNAAVNTNISIKVFLEKGLSRYLFHNKKYRDKLMMNKDTNVANAAPVILKK